MRFCETGSTPGVPMDFEVAVLWVVVSSRHSKVFLGHKTERYHGQTW